MKAKVVVALAVSIGLSAGAANSVAQQVQPTSINKPHINVRSGGLSPADASDDQQTYILQLHEPSVSHYSGGIKDFAPTNPAVTGRKVASKQSTEGNDNAVVEYRHYLQQKQQTLLGKISNITGTPIAQQQFQLALNGVVVKLTEQQLQQVKQLPGIKSIEPDRKFSINSDTSPTLTGATDVWNGNTLEGINALGEGTVIAIFDTGINTDHPSFAATGGDGYTHINPLGAGNYLGDCEVNFATLCNDKLIGVYSYPLITDDYADTSIFPPALARNGEDYNGHGSHVAGTAAGNILYDVPSYGLAYDLEQSDGYPGAFTFDRIAGIAPHANIISFQVCLPGENDDAYNGCYASLAVSAIETSIELGIVDAINYSISGGETVWGDALSEAWLAANNAGIFVAHSAGNDGPERATSDKYAPWLTAVAATNHGRIIDFSKQITSFSGGSTRPSTLSGVSNTGAITASVVFAGDYPNANDPNGDPAQCLAPYPAGTFNGEIVLCERGDVARIQKAINVAEGGAGGFILANVSSDSAADNLVADEYVVPGIHVSAEAGTQLKNWLASGSGHRATITTTAGILTYEPDSTDQVAGFSSRGPNNEISTLLPMLSAPGVNIYAAYSDEHYGHEETGPAPADYAYLNGTSMASPNVAGASLLLKQLHPDWSPDAIRSALMMTATTDLTTVGSTNSANWLDMGAGRIRIANAADASLIIEETQFNYQTANPADGGDPKALNLPALVDNNCLVECQWQRTVTATRSGSWTLSFDEMDSNLTMTVSPATFTLAAGQSQTITFSLSALNTTGSDWAFGQVLITSGDNNDLHLPVAVVASNGNFPDDLQLTSQRNADSILLTELISAEITDFTYSSTHLTRGTKLSASIGEDSSPNNYLDDTTDGVYYFSVNIPANTPRFVLQITESDAPDLDVYVILDEDSDGTFSTEDLIAASTGYSWDEYISIDNPPAGTLEIFVHNYSGSGTLSDDFTLDYAVVDNGTDGMLSVDAPSATGLREPFDMRVLWSLDSSLPGDWYYGSVTLGSSSSTPDNLGTIPVDIVRGINDVQVSPVQSTRFSPGDTLDYQVTVAQNNTNEDRQYEIDVELPAGTSVVPGSVTGNGTVSGNVINWSLTQNITAQDSGYVVSRAGTDALCTASQNARPYIDLSALGYAPTQSNQDFLTAGYAVPVTLYNQHYQHIVVSSKGFIELGSHSSIPHPSAIRTLASGAYPQTIIAPFWHDWRFSDDKTAGITVATIADQGITVIEWSGMQSDYYRGDFEVILVHQPQAGTPSVRFAYRNIEVLSNGTTTTSIGIQDSTGTQGSSIDAAALFASVTDTAVQSASLCFTAQGSVQATGPAELRFGMQISDTIQDNATIPVTITSRVPNIPGTSQEISEVNTEVELHAAPEIRINGVTQASLTLTERLPAVLPITVSDANGDAITLTVNQLSGPAAAISVSGETVTVTPAAASRGTALRLQVIATDSYGFTDEAVVDITVVTNQPPVLTVTAPASVQEGTTITIRASATDPEDDTVTFTINSVPGATYSMTAPSTDNGTSVSFTVTATDGYNTVTETVTVSVTNRPSGGGGSLTIGSLLGLLLLIGWRRRAA